MDAGNVWAVKGRSSEPQDKTIIQHIMLRYRPIAPKPVPDGSASGPSPAKNTTELVTMARKKRKYVRVKQTRRSRKVCKQKEDKDAVLVENNVDLRLDPGGSSINLDFTVKEIPFLMDFSKSDNNGVYVTGEIPDQADRTVLMKPVRVIETWVIVDGITDTWLDNKCLGSSDMEKMKNLEMDICPGLVTDGFRSVRWMNLAYRRMVDPLNDGDSPAQVVVWLVMNGKLPAVLGEAFACTVRVVYSWRKEKYSHTMPCDVWKMEFGGGFAWRFDIKAALSLGL